MTWLRANPAVAGASVVTSLPDVSELGTTLDRWRDFFSEAAAACLAATPPAGVTVFFQTDIKRDGRWVSKAAPILLAAETAGAGLLWHKVVCRKPVGTALMGRPGYSHLLAFSQEARDEAARATADVLPELGDMPWSHSMGLAAAQVAVQFIRRASPTTERILAPFCGTGAVLAVANRAGLHAVGIERNRKRAEAARSLRVE